MKRSALFLSASLFLLAFKAPAQDYGATVRENYPFQEVGSGQAGNMKDGDYTFTSQADYVHFWNDVFGDASSPPGVIGEGEMMLLLKHTRASGSTALILGPAVETTTSLLLRVKFNNSPYHSADMNYGYTLVKLRNPNKPVVFLFE